MQSLRKKICFVVTEPMTVRAFLVDQLRALSERYDLSLVTNAPDASFLANLGISGRTIPMLVKRDINPKQDIVALAKLWRFFKAEKFDCVHSVTPKAGLLTALAGTMARVPNRLHTFTGQVWVTRSGIMRLVLKMADKTIAKLNTHVLADSHSQREFLVTERVLRTDKCSVLGEGSISGVDLNRFRPDTETRTRLRKNSDVPPDALVFLFIGRLTRDKGVQDLVRAFNAASEKMPNAYLWIVGPDEQGVTKEARQACSRYADRVRFFCGTMTPEQFMAAADVLSLPSYREGFGSVVIEAAAVGIPAIVSRIYGLTDAVEDGVTGLFHEVRNVEEIADRMVHIACDPELRKRLGENARRRAVKHFSKDALTSALMEFYSKLFRWHRLQQGGVGCKRAVDVVCAAVGLVAVSPVLAVVSLLIWATMGRPVLFRQQRPGRLGVPFTIHKLRTMTDQRGPSGELLDDRVRLTGFGKFLRRASLDELPQLWNVLMGDMSLVGPRPLLTEYLERYTPEQHRRHQVKPGMTGWAQVHGRQCIPFSRRLELDAWYVDHWSFWLDLRILVLTVTRMLGGTGVRSGQDTREVDDLGLHPAVRNREKAND